MSRFSNSHDFPVGTRANSKFERHKRFGLIGSGARANSAAMTPLLLLKDITVAFGGSRLLDGAELSVAAGERLCLVGRNGSGKSTLLKIAAGLVEADAGTRFAQPGATIRYLPQEPDLSGFATTRDYVEAGLASA